MNMLLVPNSVFRLHQSTEVKHVYYNDKKSYNKSGGGLYHITNHGLAWIQPTLLTYQINKS